MKRLQLIAMLISLLMCGSSQAARPRGYFFRARPHVSRPALSYEQKYQYLNWRYPKYVGGFHYSYFRDLGVAPGDVGFRTNGVIVTPW